MVPAQRHASVVALRNREFLVKQARNIRLLGVEHHTKEQEDGVSHSVHRKTGRIDTRAPHPI
jgi:hypothetical protein